MRKCCIYCRIDGAPMESNQHAMKSQLQSLREAAVLLGLTIAAEITVFESGLDPLRQSIKTLIRMVGTAATTACWSPIPPAWHAMRMDSSKWGVR